jgi:hypothetical protein
MGNWYTNVSLKDVEPLEVLSHLNELGRNAIVTPSIDGWVVVYDHKCDEFDIDTLESLALTLSTRLGCTAIACFNADDDILWFCIYDKGKRSSRFASDVSQFEDAGEFPVTREFATELCRVFEKPDRVRQAHRVLRRPHNMLGILHLIRISVAYLFEISRHQELAAVVGLPAASVGLGYTYVNRGELASGMQPERLLHTQGRASL